MKKLSLFLLAMLCCVSTSLRASELTVANGTNTNYKIPFAPGSADSYQRMQFIYEASSLSAMNGSSIYQMTFYTSNEIATNWGDALFKVALAEVTETDFGTVDDDAAFISADTTKVYSGQFSVFGNELVIEFKKPFAYNGGNLLLEVELFYKGIKSSAYFIGTNTEAVGAIHGVIGTSSFFSDITKVDTYGGKQRFIPKTTFAYGSKSSCTKPTGLIAYNVTYNSAKIGWSTEELVSYTLEYKKIGKYNKWTVIENASNGTVLSDLDEFSTYLVRLKKDCGEEESAYATTSFFTPCSPLTIEDSDHPFTENFDAVESDILNPQIPDCWYKIANGDYPYVSSSVASHSGSKCLYFSGGGTTYVCIIILPTFENLYNELALSFWYKNDYTDDEYAQAQIGYMTDKRFASTFVAIQNLDKVTEYTHVQNVSLADIPSNAYLAIQLGGGTKLNKLYIDDISVSLTTPTCPKPVDLTVEDIAHNGATVTWDKGSAATSVLQYKRSDEEVWTTVNNATSPYELTGLEATTSYDVHVKNSCGEIGESDYCATSTFTTPCAPFMADSEHPFSENFDDVDVNTIPDCWDNSEENTAKSGTKWNNGTAGRNESRCMMFRSNTWDDNGYYNLLKTRDIHIGSTAALSFYYRNPINAGFSVWYTIDDGVQTLLDDAFTQQDNWILYEHELPAACVHHNIKLIFKGISNETGSATDISGAAYISIDDILVTCAETCPRPTLADPVVTGNAVSVSWTAGGSESEWQYICQPTADPVDWNGSAVKTATSAPVELADLNPATNYTFYLRAKCAADDLSAVVSKDFKTECAASISSLICGFEESEGYTSGELPECWNTINASSTIIVTNEGTPASGSQHLRISGAQSGQIVILPRFNQEIKNLQIFFKFKRTSGAALYLASVTDPANTSSWNVFTNSFSEGYDSYTAVDEYELTKARSGDYYLAFFYYTSGDATLYLDDIVVEPIPTCKAPTNLYVSTDPTATTVGLNWTENGPAEEWLIQVSSDNGETWDAGTEANTKPFTLTGLASSTEYKARVKAVCSESDSSKWSNVIDFTTEAGSGTALDNTSAEAAATKLIRNGQVLINRNGILYTLTGQEVK